MPYSNTVTLKVDNEGKEKLAELEEYYETYLKVVNPRSSVVRRALDDLYEKLLGETKKQTA